jgi:elongation factor P
MADTSEIRKGVVIRHQGGLFVVSDFKFVNPGKGSAFTRTKMKNLATGKSLEVTYKSSETVEIVDVEYIKMQYLYKSGDNYAFMNQESYETIELGADIVGDDGRFLKEGVEVDAAMFEGATVSIRLPKKITYTVVEAPDGVKGNSASGNVTKEVVMDNGLHAQVPMFIKEGETIIISTDTGDYVGRAGEDSK